jgi:hypothetical protein
MITVTTKTAYFISDSKLSGDVIIMNENGEVRVSGLDLLDFVANKVRTEKIEELEQMSAKRILFS